MSVRKHIPNAITSMNLLCGSLGVAAAFTGHIGQAFLLMLAGATADFFDGFSARLLGVSSPMGKELDSIADTVSFGLLPAIMMSVTLCGRYGADRAFCWVPMMIAIFSGLRLAKFNIDQRQTSSFLGLPTPACAMICGSLAYFVDAVGTSGGTIQAQTAAALSSAWVIIPLSVVLSALLVSEIPMFSMKFHKNDKIGAARIAFATVAALSALAVGILGFDWSLIVLSSFTGYILINLAEACLGNKAKI